jgi:hypothetical protein
LWMERRKVAGDPGFREVVQGVNPCLGTSRERNACRGRGPGPNVFDTLTPLVQWVEQGTAPERIVATKFAGDNPANGVLMTRPLCAFPEFAEHKGKSSTNDASRGRSTRNAGADESVGDQCQ